jgi:hypothetical protein
MNHNERPERATRHIPATAIPPTAARRLRARFLDPSTAVRSDGQELEPTAYVGDVLIVPGILGRSADRSVGTLERVAHDLGYAVVPDSDESLVGLATEHELLDTLDKVGHTAVRLVPLAERGEGGAIAPADAWEVLQTARALDGRAVAGVGLAHVMTASGWGQGIGWGQGFGWGQGIGWGQGLGWGQGIGWGPSDRFPVVWSAPPPVRQEGGPVVATLDTGLGEHDWFIEGDSAERLPEPPGMPHELDGVSIDLVNGQLDPLAGHGTFIAGVVRQHCPDARILSVPVMWGDGTADERDVVQALAGLYLRQSLAMRPGGDAGRAIDVITLSLGYRHETPGAFDDEEALFRLLRGLAELGVTVVAAVGNDASDVEFFPAAYAPHVTAGAPMVSVGALNPDRRTVSVYSNTGPWVQTYAAATSIVSTMPTTFNASRRSELLRQSNSGVLPAMPTRGAADSDDYSGGFGLWSGTSFAAPALAGDIARALGRDRPAEVEERSKRAREVVTVTLSATAKSLREEK